MFGGFRGGDFAPAEVEFHPEVSAFAPSEVGFAVSPVIRDEGQGADTAADHGEIPAAAGREDILGMKAGPLEFPVGDADDVVAETVGRPAPSVELRLLDPDGAEVTAGGVASRSQRGRVGQGAGRGRARLCRRAGDRTSRTAT